MRLYLHHNLAKSKSDGKISPQKNQPGEQRGGNYVSRVQIGYEKDGSPRYKYFKTTEERDKYLQNRGKAKTKSPRLKAKVKKEQKDSKAKQDATQGKVSSGKLFVKDKKASEEEKVSKAIPHFIWRID